jgi:hypothetical protein
MLVMTAMPHALLEAGTPPSGGGGAGLGKEDIIVWAKRIRQGYGMKVWMSTELALGAQMAPRPSLDIGLEYPAGSGFEHLYGGGPLIGGVVNGARRVSAAFWESSEEFRPDIMDTVHDRIWVASASDTLEDPERPGYYKRQPSVRGWDDDGDGKIDEDELDGADNDGDWDRLADDIGADGVPDSLEVGCQGAYNAQTNPDPAYDNYEPTKLDFCHRDASGAYPRKDGRDRYTEKNGLPDHGEPHVDEDYGAVSDHDVYMASTDTMLIPAIGNHVPMGIKIWQRSFAWQGRDLEAILPFEYYFVNVGRNIITDVYVGWTADMDIGPVSVSQAVGNNYAAYIPALRTAYMHNAIDRGATPLGVTVLGTSKPLTDLTYTFQWYIQNDSPVIDSLRYAWMSCEQFQPQCIKPSQSPTTPNDSRIFFSFGPFAELMPGDTLKIVVALVSGYGLEEGVNPLVENAKTALKLYASNWRTPVIPVSPCLNIEPGFKKVTLRWGRTALCQNGRPGVDPMSIWDDDNKIAASYPPDHWRRVNPPPGHVTGGRIFEGYRIYRSEDPLGTLNSFTLVKQLDIDDEFAYNTGLDTMFVDTNLVRGKRYWYAVTSFGLPDRTINESSPSPGVIIYDTLYTSNPESPIEANMQSVDLTFSPSNRLGDVLVVPNPYRVDNDYTSENGGWEGRGREWTENNRLLKFIHLPPKCTIRVFSIAGDEITTLQHDDPVRGEYDWDILSGSFRALASGVYIYTVESDFGKQIGKFVLIR